MDRAAKKESIAELSEVFKTSSVVVVAHYAGLTVAQMQQLRRQMQQAGGKVKVAKTRLAQVALKATDVASIAPLLKGPTVLAYSKDPIAAPKVATDFAKANEQFVILGGSMGKTALDQNGVKALASLPSLDELRARAWEIMLPHYLARLDGFIERFNAARSRGQATADLADAARARGLNGIIYPSVRHEGGTCIAALFPHAVQSVAQGDVYRMTWNGAPDPLVEKVAAT